MFSVVRDKLSKSINFTKNNSNNLDNNTYNNNYNNELLDNISNNNSQSSKNVEYDITDIINDLIERNSDISNSTYTNSITSNSSGLSFFNKIGLRRKDSYSSSIDLCEFNPKQSVIKVLKTIKQIDKCTQTTKIGLIKFLEILQMNYYKHVSLNLLSDFMKIYKPKLKPVYIHYYLYFLYYAEYYHHIRSSKDIIDISKVDFHKECLCNIKTHIKYLYKYLKSKKNKQEVITEITL